MKLGKLFGLTALAAVLMSLVLASSASATILTGAGGTTLGVGTKFKAESEGTVTLHPPFGDIECELTWFTYDEVNAGGSTTTPGLTITEHTWNCRTTFHVLKVGSIEIHTRTSSADTRGRVTLSGSEWTVEFFGTHCIFGTNNTEIGTLTGSSTTGGNATMDIEATIPRTGGRSGVFCGSSAQWTGSYKITEPSVVNVD